MERWHGSRSTPVSAKHDTAVELMLEMWPCLQLHEMRFLARMLDETVEPVKYLGFLYADQPLQEQMVSRIAEVEAHLERSIV
jgi:hypothetical protein